MGRQAPASHRRRYPVHQPEPERERKQQHGGQQVTLFVKKAVTRKGRSLGWGLPFFCRLISADQARALVCAAQVFRAGVRIVDRTALALVVRLAALDET